MGEGKLPLLYLNLDVSEDINIVEHNQSVLPIAISVDALLNCHCPTNTGEQKSCQGQRRPGTFSVFPHPPSGLCDIHLNQTADGVFGMRVAPGIHYQLPHARERENFIACAIHRHQPSE